MAGILCHLAIQDGAPRRSSLEAMTRCRDLARSTDRSLDVAILDPSPRKYVGAAARYGADRIFLLSHPAVDRPVNELLLGAIERVVTESRPDVVVFASSESVKDVLGALSIRLSAAVLPDVSAFTLDEDSVTALRPVMASKMLARTRAATLPVLVSVRSGSYTAVEQASMPETIDVSFSPDESSMRVRLREIAAAAGEVLDLSEARVVVSAGRGVKDQEGQRLIGELATLLGAATGATRAAVETNLYPATAQIGQTGKVVAPDLYFAVGISGAVQHVAGMLNSRVIVAINKDPEAPIFRYATYGVVGDLYRVLPLLIEELRR